MKNWNWTAIGAIGTLLGGLAAVFTVLTAHPAPSAVQTTQVHTSTAFYIDGCQQRIRAINLRAAQRAQSSAPALDFEAPHDWCKCTARTLETNFDDQTVRSVGEWFQAVALGRAEQSAEDAFFAGYSPAERSSIEGAYDFATRQCNQRNGQR